MRRFFRITGIFLKEHWYVYTAPSRMQRAARRAYVKEVAQMMPIHFRRPRQKMTGLIEIMESLR